MVTNILESIIGEQFKELDYNNQITIKKSNKPDLCDYDPKLVFDVSMDGNPQLEKYENSQYYDQDYDDEEYEQTDGYEYDD